MKDNSELRARVSSWEQGLTKIIANWNLIPGCAKDEFDPLMHKVIGHLTKGATKDKIHDVLESELTVRYGLSPNEFDLEQWAIEIIDWWNVRK